MLDTLVGIGNGDWKLGVNHEADFVYLVSQTADPNPFRGTRYSL